MDLSIAWLLLLLLALSLWWWGWRRAMAVFEAHGEDIWDSRLLYRLDGAVRLFCEHHHRFRHDPVPLPDHGGAVLVCNHISGLDPFLLGVATRRPLRFLVAREQYSRPGCAWFFKGTGCIPVDRSTRPERAFRAALDALAKGEVIAVFPHGGIHLDSDPPRALKSGAVRMAQLAGVPVVPVHLSGIKGIGRVMGALLPRSRARLTAYAPLDCSGKHHKPCLETLEALLRGCPGDVHCPGYAPISPEGGAG